MKRSVYLGLIVPFFIICVHGQATIDALPAAKTFTELLSLGPKRVEGLTIGQPTPNELKGLKLLTAAKLSKIRMGSSQRIDVRKAFGSTCENGSACAVAPNWRVSFEYYNDPSGITSITVDKTGTHQFELVVNPEYIGRLSKITFVPKKSVSVPPSSFGDAFYRGCAQPMGSSFVIEGQKLPTPKEEFVVRYYDAYGLEYTVVDGSTNEDCFETGKKRAFAHIERIEYVVPQYLEKEKVFTARPIR